MLEKRVYINSYAGISPSMSLINREENAEPDYKDFIKDAGVRRRMSRIIKMGVASALMCIKEGDNEHLDGIITGTGWGCLADTEKFLNSILENGERLLNPTSFIQSTSNTIGAQIALLEDEKNYNNTFVNGGTSFEAALIDGILKLQEEENSNILVGGLDEITPTKNHLLERMGVWRSTSPGEGSHFFLLSTVQKSSSIAIIELVKTFSKQGSFNLLKEFDQLLFENNLNFNMIDKILCGESTLCKLLSQREEAVVCFKNYCGEYPTASAFALWHACTLFNSDTNINRIVIINRHLKDQFSLIVVRRVKI